MKTYGTVSAAEQKQMSGLEFVKGLADGRLPLNTIAKTLETTEAELIRTIFPHPTISETMHEAVLDAYGGAIHF